MKSPAHLLWVPTQARQVLAWTCLAAAVIVALARPLVPYGFVSGDQGVKLIAATNAIAHPTRPTEIDLPIVAGRAVTFVDRFFTIHDQHAHALQSPLFPLLTAPLVAMLGLRGAYVLPALGFVLLLPLLRSMARTVPHVPVATLGICAVLANPLFFYAFEIWEHVPAVAVLAASTALAMPRRGSSSTCQWLGGALAGVAVLLRPEAIWYAFALGVLVGPSRQRLAFLCGGSVVFGSYLAANYLEGGSVVGYHAAANLSTLPDRWVSTRFERLQLWLLPAAPVFLLGLTGLAAAWALWWKSQMDRALVVGLAAAAAIAVGRVLGLYPSDSLWYAWPLGAIVFVPLSSYAGLGSLFWLAGATSLGVWLTSTHDGGTQWGPRFLLISTPALVVLAAAALSESVRAGGSRMLRLALVGVIVGCGLWTSRAAYVDLRGWKRYYGTLATEVGRETGPGAYIVTNVWWLDQICASLHGTRTFLVTTSDAESSRVFQILQQAGVKSAYLAWSSEPGQGAPLSVAGSCYQVAHTTSLRERSIHVAKADCVE